MLPLSAEEPCSAPVLDNDEEIYGDVIRREDDISSGKIELVLLGARWLEGSVLIRTWDVVLRGIRGSSGSGSSALKKNEAFDAVIGVTGLFGGLARDGVESTASSPVDASFNESIFDVIGVLSGNKFKGGSLSG